MANVLNNGTVSLVESMGRDAAVIRNARRCWRSSSKGQESDAKLIRHLLRAGHKSPFEAMVFTFDVKAPLFVARQWFRHRMGSFNEESLRYCTASRDFFVPEDLAPHLLDAWNLHNNRSFDLYEQLTGAGVPKEQARSVLPMGIYTRFYWTVNGSSLMNFLTLRLDRHAQPEIRVYARAILGQAQEVAPVCFGEFASEVLTSDGCS